jgi:hypothetical protein
MATTRNFDICFVKIAALVFNGICLLKRALKEVQLLLDPHVSEFVLGALLCCATIVRAIVVLKLVCL